MFKIFYFVMAILCLSARGFHLPCSVTPLKINYPEYFGNKIVIPEDNPTTEQGVKLGRMLFYETALSANNLFSCATCHQQSLAFTDGKQFSTGIDGTAQPRNTMSLANLLWVRRFFWDGRAEGLEKQVETPMTGEHEMGQPLVITAKKLHNKSIYASLFKDAFGTDSITGERIMKALSQFERTLVSANSSYDKYLRGEYKPTPSERNGMALFFASPNPANRIRGAACGHCHAGPKTFSELFHNNGLDSFPKDPGLEKITGQEYDRGRFRVVTLRNIALTAPYMHDGRFKTLEEVVEHYNEHLIQSSTLSIFLQNNSNKENDKLLNLTAQEKTDLVFFLKMLTDSTFITAKRFSNPFK
ncbi:MAG: cytochrome c peroxidase [Chitinophagaceae bacterium]